MNQGHRRWIIPDGYLPVDSSGDYVSHESICVLNIGESDADITITVYFEDQDPITFKNISCQSKRTNHIRIDQLDDEVYGSVPRGVPYAIELVSTVAVITQHSRLDSSQSALALFTTMAFPI